MWEGRGPLYDGEWRVEMRSLVLLLLGLIGEDVRLVRWLNLEGVVTGGSLVFCIGFVDLGSSSFGGWLYDVGGL